MNIKGIIWGTTVVRACRILEDMESRYHRYGCKTITKGRDWISFDNGDIWKAVGNVESTRG